jgi:hypothetical protein
MIEAFAAPWPRRLSAAWAFLAAVIGGVVFVQPWKIAGDMRIGTPLYIGSVIWIVTYTLDRGIRLVLGRHGDDGNQLWIPVVTAVIGLLAGEWALTNTMGGPTRL